MDINTYQATIMFMGLANDARRMQHWSVVSNVIKDTEDPNHDINTL
jgi:hypothetical protein